MVAYEARNIVKRFGRVTALDGASISVDVGEVVGLVGDNGAGKSSLVKVLSGVSRPDAGTLLLDGVERSWHDPREALAAGIETLYQDTALAPDLSISANFFLGREELVGGLGRPFKVLSERRMAERTKEAFARIGTKVPDPRQQVRTLSGGQRQAIAIARSVAWANKVILLDEPTNHLGAQQKLQVLEVIREARKLGLGIILISHALPEVLEVTDRIVVLRLGEVVSEGPTSEYTPESLVRAITGLGI